MNERNGQVIGAIQANADDEVMLISDKGTMVRMPVSEISLIGRNTQGVRLVQLAEGERVVNLERIVMNIEGDKPDGERNTQSTE